MGVAVTLGGTHMARSFTAGSLVQLPRLTAIGAARLAQELLSTAGTAEKEKELPAAIAAARDDLETAREALSLELQKRQSGEGDEPPVVRAADKVEDNAVGALVDWLRSFTRLPAARHEQAAMAQTILDDTFRGGLEFLKLKPKYEWQEVEVRKQILADKGHEETIAKLGGQPFLDELSTAHEAYGEALEDADVPADTPAIREQLDNVVDELRSYVLAVSSQVKKKDPTTRLLADRLLAPLIHWQDSPPKAAPAAGGAAPAVAAPDTSAAPKAADKPAGK